ncbi:tRNA 2-thiocytidine(32) synthetase TtcA [Halothermothrix orenii]|uniref:PP-loop domain protein n=1 Tax=Halothermothrix orenii (strain H 168 / OCM 544 / DSM 9562) TaxID=373903 RepID=B8CZY7_HALOH|nr:tRNA 2-thiocytidine(32) synthetase TtcA [Halothermothrix orenii]ACL70839.1 PP-loop domain protein [Halothermothrix orenii H 168]
MKLRLPKRYVRKVSRAITEFDMIEEGDNILVGLSGGKDSSFLLYVLALINRYASLDFRLAALTVDLGFDGGKNYFDYLKNYCDRLGVKYYVLETEIASYILSEKTEKPCARCAHFRKGAIVDFMKENGFNKIAYGHHYDDAVETFLMSILYAGQVKTFLPKTYLSRNEVYVIRPLVYLRESEIIRARKYMDYNPPESPCPYDGQTTRDKVKKLLRELASDKQIFYNIAAAMREGSVIDLWPEKPPQEEIIERSKKLWTSN